MIETIKYSYPLDYEDVLQFIPLLTLDNNVKTNGRILHLEISYFKKLLHLFIDTRTKEYCFNNTNIEDLISKKVLFSIKEIAELGIIKSDMCKKLIYNREIEIVKLGKKNFITRTELIRYLKSRTVSAINFTNNKKLSA